MYDEKELELISVECLTARIQDFTYGKYFEKFKTKCIRLHENHTLLIIDVVNKTETLNLFDQSDSFSEDFLHRTTSEINQFFNLLNLKQGFLELEVNIVRQYAS